MLVLRIFLLVITVLFSASRVHAECYRGNTCEQFWVAGQHVGLPLAFFSQIAPPTNVREIKIGDDLVAALDINLRQGPADYSGAKGVLRRGTVAIVEDVKRLEIEGKSQIWLKISVVKEAIIKARSNAPVPRPQSPTAESDETPPLTGAAAKVIGCYKKIITAASPATIAAVHDCSGYWVSPTAFMLCAYRANCPVIPDTLEGKAIFDSLKLSISSPLVLDPKLIPALPKLDIIQNCKGNTRTETAFLECAVAERTKAFDPMLKCFGKITDGEKLSCFAAQVKDDKFNSLVNCLAGGKPSPDKIASCVVQPELRKKVYDLRDCVLDASEGNSARKCLSDAVPGPQRAMLNCMATSQSAGNPVACLDGLSPAMKNARATLDCLRANAALDTAACLAPHLNGDAAKIAQCLTRNSEVEKAACLVGSDSKELQAVRRAYECVSGGRNAQAMIVNCTDGVLDAQTRQVLSCASEAGSDRSKLASCAASAVLPPDTARLVGCAASSQGPTSFALCAAGPSMNEEWRIAAECAVSSGGEPISFAGCTAGRLTIRELTKCLTGEVGRDCFGPNNTIVIAMNNAFSDLTRGPGKNNDIVVALNKIGELSGGPNSLINNPKQILGGPNSFANNPLGGSGSVFHDPGQVIDPRRWRF